MQEDKEKEMTKDVVVSLNSFVMVLVNIYGYLLIIIYL